MTHVNPIQLQKFLSGLGYPASKGEVVSRAQSNGADPEVIQTLRQLPPGNYDAPTDVSREIGKLE